MPVSTIKANTATHLGKPGDGLPGIETFMLKRLVFPLVCQFNTVQNATGQVVKAGKKALKLAQFLPDSQLNQPVLINRLTGMEYSSRQWSVLMTLQHLLITGSAMAAIVNHLTHGLIYPITVKVENVKPQPHLDAGTVFEAYEQFLSGYEADMQRLYRLDWQTCHHNHPWFGPISAYQWLCLNGMHHHLHFKQIQHINKQLG
jgi:hypothetical protein